MAVSELVLIIFAGSVIAGVVGALEGLGGGVLVVPLLTVALGVDVRYAIGASIVSVIATSSGAAAAYVRDRITNLRVGMVLELATTTGAITGALVAGLVHPAALFVLFGLVLAISVVPLVAKLGEELPSGVVPDLWARRLRLGSSYYDAVLKRRVSYEVTRLPLGLGMMWVAGVTSGLLGIGSGTFKVLAMPSSPDGLPRSFGTGADTGARWHRRLPADHRWRLTGGSSPEALCRNRVGGTVTHRHAGLTGGGVGHLVLVRGGLCLLWNYSGGSHPVASQHLLAWLGA